MSHRRQYENSHGMERKRKSDQHDLPPKRPRQSNGEYQRSHVSVADAVILPDPMPDLPPLAAKYKDMVFTHPSAAQARSSSELTENYDRLEFLGDAYIEIIASKLIFENHPQANAGMANGGTKGWTKIYGDVFEAYAAAIVLSDPLDGQAVLETWLKALWLPILREVEVKLPDQNVNNKEQLANAIACPKVRLEYVEERKPIVHVGSGRETFFYGVYLQGWGYQNQHLGSGEGHSKSIAGNIAALNALSNHPLIDDLMDKKKAYVSEKAAGKIGKEAGISSDPNQG